MAEQERMLVEYRSQGGVDVRLTPKMVTDYLVQGRREFVKIEEKQDYRMIAFLD